MCVLWSGICQVLTQLKEEGRETKIFAWYLVTVILAQQQGFLVPFPFDPVTSRGVIDALVIKLDIGGEIVVCCDMFYGVEGYKSW